jgi:hypothetical protein
MSLAASGTDPQVILMRLIEVHAAIPTVGLLIAVTLPPAIAVHRLATVSRLLPPRGGLSRSDLVPWPDAAVRRNAAGCLQLS